MSDTSKLVYSTNSEDVTVEPDVEVKNRCPQCSVGTISIHEIWAECSNCDYSDRVHCCHSCAGLE